MTEKTDDFFEDTIKDLLRPDDVTTETDRADSPETRQTDTTHVRPSTPRFSIAGKEKHRSFPKPVEITVRIIAGLVVLALVAWFGLRVAAR